MAGPLAVVVINNAPRLLLVTYSEDENGFGCIDLDVSRALLRDDQIIDAVKRQIARILEVRPSIKQSDFLDVVQ
jgi:hypothetical protein